MPQRMAGRTARRVETGGRRRTARRTRGPRRVGRTWAPVPGPTTSVGGRARSAAGSRPHAPELFQREGRRADRSGVVAEPGGDDRDAGTMLLALHRVDERRPRGLEQQITGDHGPAPHDDDLRVDDVHEPRDPLAQSPPRLRQDADRDIVTLLRRLGHQVTRHALRISLPSETLPPPIPVPTATRSMWR